MRRRLLIVAALLGLAGCGFKPMYAERSGVSVNDDLQAVRIAPLPNRIGQILHNYLRDDINPYGQPAQPVYELRIGLAETTEDSGIRRDETASREIITMRAAFELVDIKADSVVYEGQARSSTAYNILDDRFASIISADNARDRALRELSA
ncbi:MAG TPA: LPS assembly lipoprotein LptE, partial [Kiloniellales bacterium]|nr:LPS assembly lipoprotein LptE [Kiloniellales bacterium]